MHATGCFKVVFDGIPIRWAQADASWPCESRSRVVPAGCACGLGASLKPLAAIALKLHHWEGAMGYPPDFDEPLPDIYRSREASLPPCRPGGASWPSSTGTPPSI